MTSALRFAGILVAAALVFASSPASALCDPDTALFEDDFAFLDVSWGDADDSIGVEDGTLVVRGNGGVVNLETKNEGASICVDMTIVSAPKIPNSPTGLVFWWQDWDNYYSLFIWADGWLEVRRMVDGTSKTVFTEEVDALKTGAGATNSIELMLRSKDATVSVNTKTVRRFKAKQPKQGGAVGLFGISPNGAPALFSFDNFVVNER